MKTKETLLLSLAAFAVTIAGWRELASFYPRKIGVGSSSVTLGTSSPNAPASDTAPSFAINALNEIAVTSETTDAPASFSASEETAVLVAEIRDAFASLALDRLDVALSRLLPALVQKDPSTAAQLAESIAEPNLRGEVLHLVARLWGRKDPESALTWAGGLKIEYEREAALTDAGRALARENPALALQWSARSFRADEPAPVLDNLTQQWAERDFPEALRWTLEHSRGVQRNDLLARLALVESNDEPRAAARLVLEEMTPGETQNETIISVLHQWARRDLSGALAWMDRFPAGPLRERATAEVNSIARFRLTLTEK